MKAIFKSIVNACITEEIPNWEYMDVDWEDIYPFCEKNRIVEPFVKLFNEYIPEPQKVIFASYIHQRRIALSDRLQLLKEVIGIFEKYNIPYCLNKGLAFSKLFYNDVFLRAGNDIDFLVQDGPGALNVLQQYGFQQSYKGILTMPCPIIFDGNAHEYRGLITQKYPNQLIEIAISLHNIRGEYKHSLFFKHSHPIHLVDDLFVNTFDLEYQFINACSNIYNDDETKDTIRARNYIDVGRCVLLFYNCINWQSIVQLAEHLELTHCLYYTLNGLLSIVDTSPLKEMLKSIIEMIDPNKFNPSLRKYFVNNICGLNNWEQELLDRMIINRNNIKMIRKKLLHKRNYSQSNPHMRSPIPLFCSQNSQCFNSDILSFFIEKYNSYLKYIIIADNNLLMFKVFLDNNISTLLNQLTFNVRLFNPIVDDDTKIEQVDIAWQCRNEAVQIKKSSHSDSSVKAFNDLNPDENIEGVTVEIMPKTFFLLTIDLLKLGFEAAAVPLAFKLYLQENFMINDNISISHNLVGYSDNEIIADWKNGLSIEYTYPNIIMLTT